MPDAKGRTIPADATRGQVLWSADGADSGVVLVGRSEQADFARGLASSYACAHCCRDSYDISWPEPGSMVGTVGEASQLIAIQQNVNCYGTRLDPFQVSPYWWSSDSSVASIDSWGWTTAHNMGSTTFYATWPVAYWSLDSHYCRIMPEDCVGPCRRGFEDAVAPAPGLVGEQTLHFLRVSYSNLSASFERVADKDTATLNLGNASDADRICAASTTTNTFAINLEFTFPVNGELFGKDDPRNQVFTGGNNQFEWMGWDFGIVSPTFGRGSMSITLTRRNTRKPLKQVEINLAGRNPPGLVGNFFGRGKVNLNCP